MTGRHDLLRAAVHALRRCRASMAAGRLGHALEDLRSAQSATSFAAGMGHGLDVASGHYATGRAIDCTAGLRRALFETEQRLVAALEPRPVDRGALVADIAAGLMVLCARGIEISDEQILERARNIAAGLLGDYDVRTLPPPSTAHPQPGSARVCS